MQCNTVLIPDVIVARGVRITEWEHFTQTKKGVNGHFSALENNLILCLLYLYISVTQTHTHTTLSQRIPKTSPISAILSLFHNILIREIKYK